MQAVVCIKNMKSHYNVVIELICMHANSVPQSCNLRPASHTRKNPQANKLLLSLHSVGYESPTKQDYNTTN